MLSTVCTTIKVSEGHPEFWSLHRRRLQYFATVLNRTIDIAQLDLDVLRASKALQSGVIRVEVDSNGHVAYTPRKMPHRNRLRWCVEYSERSSRESTIKWLHRPSWTAKRVEYNVDVLLMLDKDDRYLECCIGNVFVYRPRERQWYTPPISLPILPGIMRSVLLQNAQLVGSRIIEASIVREQTDELWMSNAVRGLCPLRDSMQRPVWSVVDDNKGLERNALEHFKSQLTDL